MGCEVGNIFCVHGLTYAGKSYVINDVLLINVGPRLVAHEIGLETPRNYTRTKGALLQVYQTLNGAFKRGFDKKANIWICR